MKRLRTIKALPNSYYLPEQVDLATTKLSVGFWGMQPVMSNDVQELAMKHWVIVYTVT